MSVVRNNAMVGELCHDTNADKVEEIPRNRRLACIGGTFKQHLRVVSGVIPNSFNDRLLSAVFELIDFSKKDVEHNSTVYAIVAGVLFQKFCNLFFFFEESGDDCCRLTREENFLNLSLIFKARRVIDSMLIHHTSYEYCFIDEKNEPCLHSFS